MASTAGFLKKYWFYVIAGILFLAVLGGIVYMYSWGSSRFPVVGQATNFALTDEHNKPVQLTDSDGKVRLMTFVYTRCTSVCPITTFTMSQIQKNLQDKGVFGNQVQFVSVSIDPQYDTPAVLANYAKEFHADLGGWEFLTGNPTDVDKVLKAYQIQTIAQDMGQLSHPSVSLLIDRNGNIRKRYGTLKEPQGVTDDIERLLKQ